jgi:hypothetical protein
MGKKGDRHLHLFIRLLNRDPGALIRVAQRYQAAIPAQEKQIEAFARKYLEGKTAVDTFIGQAYQTAGAFRPQIVPTPGRRAHSLPMLWPLKRLRANVSPLIGKCAKCRRYFLAATRRRRRYCSEKCGWSTTAKAAVYKGRAAKKKEDLQRAVQAIRSWDGTGDWKVWVVSRTRLTRNYITTAVNRGDLKAPI